MGTDVSESVWTAIVLQHIQVALSHHIMLVIEQLTCGEKEVKRGWILSSLNWDPDVRLELTSIHNIIVYWRKILILTESYKEYSRIIITHKTIITHKMKYFLFEQIYDMICHWDFFM